MSCTAISTASRSGSCGIIGRSDVIETISRERVLDFYNAHYAPSKAILLNLYEDHLDHYGTVEKYWNAKKNIYRNQGYCDFLFCNP
ncbi:MAG: hypothetical protein IKX19_11750, partial [Clostridia bacterium]|nr:hypothetical protein [Clostridia bacterium]